MKENTERWMELARLASTEQDPVKLLALVTEINQLLMKKEERLIKEQKPDASTPDASTPNVRA
jgi:hypothetical protein